MNQLFQLIPIHPTIERRPQNDQRLISLGLYRHRLLIQANLIPGNLLQPFMVDRYDYLSLLSVLPVPVEPFFPSISQSGREN
jgi:hypothetical protein